MTSRGVIVGVLVTAAVGGAGLVVSSGGGSGCPVATVGALDGPDPWGGCWPGPQTTGVTDEGALSTVSGSVDLSVAGATYQNKTVSGGCINVLANNITIRNVRVIMPTSGCVYGICNLPYSGTCTPGDTGSHTGLLVEDVEVDCGSTFRSGLAAIADDNYTARRSYFHGNCTNTVSIAGNNVTFEDNFIDEPMDVSSFDPGDPGFPHTDALQMPDSTNVVFRHNVVYGQYESGTNFGSGAVNSGGSSYSSVAVTRNIIAGGGYATYCPVSGGGFTFTDNHFSTHFASTVGGFGPSAGCSAFNGNGNVYHETGLPVTLG